MYLSIAAVFAFVSNQLHFVLHFLVNKYFVLRFLFNKYFVLRFLDDGYFIR